jgi:hypothetical protein
VVAFDHGRVTGEAAVWSSIGPGVIDEVANRWRSTEAAAGSPLSLAPRASASFSVEVGPNASLAGPSVKGSISGLLEISRRFLLTSRYVARPRKPAPTMAPIASATPAG